MLHARRSEKGMIEACERRILEFPLLMDAREVARELKREGWYAWASSHERILFIGSSACGQKREADNADDSSQPRILAEVNGTDDARIGH